MPKGRSWFNVVTVPIAFLGLIIKVVPVAPLPIIKTFYSLKSTLIRLQYTGLYLEEVGEKKNTKSATRSVQVT